MQVRRQPLAQVAVERGQRLVEQQQPRAYGERPGQRHPLPLPAGEGVGGSLAVAGEPDELEQLRHPARPAPAAGRRRIRSG